MQSLSCFRLRADLLYSLRVLRVEKVLPLAGSRKLAAGSFFPLALAVKLRGSAACFHCYNAHMTQNASELLSRALALSEEERAELASTLIESLDTVVDDDAESAWQQEIARRLEELASGNTKALSWEAVREKGRTILNGKTRH